MRFFGRLFVSTLFLAVFSLSGSVFAQEVDGPQTSSQQFGDWVQFCVSSTQNGAEGPTSACEIRQTLTIKNDGKVEPILKLALSKASDKAGKVNWALVVVTPLNVALPADLGLSISGSKPETVRYRNCTHDGCFAIYPVDNALLERMKKGVEGDVFFRVLSGQAMKVPFSLNGFTKAFEALQSANLSSSEKTASKKNNS